MRTTIHLPCFVLMFLREILIRDILFYFTCHAHTYLHKYAQYSRKISILDQNNNNKKNNGEIKQAYLSIPL